MGGPSLTAYRFTVLMGDPENPDVVEVTAFGRDIQQVEGLFASRKWGSAQDRPMTAAIAAAYFAAVRTGKFAGDYDAWEAAYLEVAAQDPVAIRPTERAPVPASP